MRQKNTFKDKIFISMIVIALIMSYCLLLGFMFVLPTVLACTVSAWWLLLMLFTVPTGFVSLIFFMHPIAWCVDILRRTFGHLGTVNEHRKEVRKLMRRCGLYKQGLMHDLSKYSPTEFINGVRYYTGVKSPHVGERIDKGYSEAWLHHKARNKHHPEYWIDIIDGLPTPVEIPVEYIIEMFCDRVAASKTYLKDLYSNRSALEYYETHKNENSMHPKTRETLEYYLNYLSEKGENCTFEMLRGVVCNSK